MRPRTRNVTLAILGVLVVLLALGALPGLLKSGDPYYVTATVTDGSASDAAVNVTALPAARYPYTTTALANATAGSPGRSEPYWKGPIGIKGTFTHSPFDELQALEARNASAVLDGGGIYARANGTLYIVEITQP